MNSNRKGKDGERELAKALREAGYETRRGQQYCGANGDADVIGLPGIHAECKRVERLNLESAVEQAVANSRCDKLPFGFELPAVFHRRNRRPWLVTMRLDHWLDLYQAYQASIEEAGD